MVRPLFVHTLRKTCLVIRGEVFRGVYSSIIPPPPGVGEKNQRVLGLGKKIKEE